MAPSGHPDAGPLNETRRYTVKNKEINFETKSIQMTNNNTNKNN
jgi:hypothetical protein